MTYQEFLFKITSIQYKLIDYFKIIYSTLAKNFIFKTIINIIIFSIIMWVLFWCIKLLLSIINYHFYKETIDNSSEEAVILNSWDRYVPIKASKKEKAEMRESLKEFYHDSEQSFNDNDNVDF